MNQTQSYRELTAEKGVVLEKRPVHPKDHIFHRVTAILMAILIVLMAGCGGGSGEDGTGTETGRFLDSAVRGLAYETGTRSGLTDSEGRFFYEPGEVVRFAIGDILLGQTAAKAIITPTDLVRGAGDECHPTVVNLARLLQTLDQDGKPDNGIEISESVRLEAAGRRILFDRSTEAFETDEAVLTFLDALNALGLFPDGEVRGLCSADEAATHLRETLDAVKKDNAGGDGGGADSDNDGGSSSGGDSGG